MPIQHNLQCVVQNIFDNQEKNLDNLLLGPDSTIWKKSISNELGRLSDGILGRVRGTNGYIRRMFHPIKRSHTQIWSATTDP